MNTILYISSFIKTSIAKKTKAVLLLSGGNSTKSTYKLLSKKKIKWENVETFSIDERLVSKIDNNSNYKLISKNLKINYSKKVKINFLNKDFKKKLKLKNFINYIKYYKPISIIGMGDDGHFASIFAKSKQFKKIIDLNKAPDLILTEKLGKPKIKRITFNMSMLNISQKIILILNSKKKILLFFKFLKNSKKQYRPINFLINKLKNKLFISIDNKLFKLSDLNKN